MEDTQKETRPGAETTAAQSDAVSTQTDTLTIEPQKSGAAKWIIGILIIAALAGGAYYYLTQKNSGPDTTTTTGVEIPEGPVARVNGNEVSSEEYAAAVNELSQAAGAQGLDLADVVVQNQIKEQALAVLINTELLLQEASRAGITTSDEAVSTELATLATQMGGEEALASALTAYGLTQEQLRKNITTQLTIEAYLSEAVDTESIVVTEEEVQALYNQAAAAGGEGLPALADIRTEVEAQIRGTKEQQLVQTFVDALRENAEVEVLI